MKVSPNPVNGNINLSIEKVKEENVNPTQQLSSTKENSLAVNKTAFHLYDINTNSLIKEWSYSETESTSYNLNVLGIKSGWYVLKMEREGNSSTIKVFIK